MRRHIGTEQDRRRVKSLLRKEDSGWRKERLIALKMGFGADNTLEEISEVVGRSIPTLQRWFDQYRRGGLDSLLKRDYKGGSPTRRNAEVEQYLAKGLKAGRWNTAVQAQQDLEGHFKRRFSYQTVWYWLKKCAGVLRVPRPVHEKRDPAKAEAFKRHFLGILRSLPVSGKKPVKVWFADESRYGLLPVRRRLWTLRGRRPRKRWQSKYEWSDCYGALDVLEGIHIVILPPYSPELNPIKKLWDCIQDYTANKLWPSIERLDQVVALLLKDWWEDSQRVIQLVGNNYHRASANASAGKHFIILH